MRRKVSAQHVRKELLPNQSEALLRELHLLTRDGQLNADALRKLKQVNHLVGLLQPAMDDLWSRFGDPQVVEAGSGNAYLSFVLYELFYKPNEKGRLHCIEARPEQTEKAKARAAALGFARMEFQTAQLASAVFPERIHLMLALHACDTATDDAIIAAIRHNADHVALVPCCQAEVAQQLKAAKDPGAFRALYEHAWHRREFGSHLTNVIRALTLEAFGYQVTVTELIGLEHSLKNELILGRRVQRENRSARAKLEALVAQAGIAPKVVRELK